MHKPKAGRHGDLSGLFPFVTHSGKAFVHDAESELFAIYHKVEISDWPI